MRILLVFLVLSSLMAGSVTVAHLSMTGSDERILIPTRTGNVNRFLSNSTNSR